MSQNILVVDDDPGMRTSVRRVLSLDGHSVDEASSIAEMMDRENWADYAAILLDRRVADGNADELLPRIRQLAPKAAVIIVTAYADMESTIAALRRGAADYLIKPVNPDVLRSTLRRIVELRRAEEELQELRHQARQRERLAEIGAIVAKVVHDMGNILAGLSMQAHLLDRRIDQGKPIESLREPAKLLVSQVGHLDALIREFRNFAREQRLNLASVDLAAEVGEIAQLWRPVAEKRGISLDVEVRDDVPRLVADAEKLRRVFDNLVRNAIEAIDHGPGAVTIRIETLRDDGRVRVSVTDTGCGVPEGIDIFRLFETTKAQGTGLGLPVSKQIVLAHGGGIRFAPVQPRGTQFSVDLPFSRVPERTDVREDSAAG